MNSEIDFHISADFMDYEPSYLKADYEPIPEGQISIGQMAELFMEMDSAGSFELNNFVAHVGTHPAYGEIVVYQWAADDFAFLSCRTPGPALGFTPPDRKH